MAGGVSPSVLLGWYQSFYAGKGTGTSASLITGAQSGSGASTAATPAVLYAPTPPWDASVKQPSQSQLVQQALGGGQLFNPSAAKLNLPGASADYKNLFALYSGLNTLFALSSKASATGVTTAQLSEYSTAFANGMSQLQSFLGQTSFSKLKLTSGALQSSQTSSVSTPAQASTYTTAALNTSGDSNAEVPAFEGNVVFNINAQLGGTKTTVPIDLSQMGATPRTMGNVVAFLNDQLQAAGVFASFSSDAIPATPDTITVGGKSVTVSSGEESWALQLHTNSAETISFSAPQSGAAVYIGQVVGNTSSTTGPTGATVAPDAQSQLLKFNASGDGVVGPSTPAHGAATQISTTGLGSSASSIQATATAPDGSVYVLANVAPAASASGAAATSTQDVALQKYDSAGHLIFSTDLGSAANAGGLSLAVSADGTQVAVSGEVTGSLTAGQTVSDPTGSNSFVAVYDNQGDQVWRQQTDGVTPNQANAVAFGSNGSVYVTGQSQTTTAVQGPAGPANSYLQVYSPKGVQVSKTQIATGGANSSNGIAVDGTDVYVAGVQNGDAVVNEYDVSTPGHPSLVASRDLGSLQGGSVVGVQVQNGQVYVAGTSGNPSLNAGTVTSAASGSGLNAFAATLSTGLAPSGSDAVAYYGGTGTTVATGMTVSGGDVYLTGTVTGDLPGEPAIGAHDGFVAALNVAAGSVDYAQRFTGLDGKVAPTSIAVASTGASVLDQLGLPQGVVDGPVSNLVTSTTTVPAGSSFGISVNGAPPINITVKATDTMASLAAEISQVTGFNVNATTSFGLHGTTALEIKPAYPGVRVSLVDGPTDNDALSALGLKPGIVADTTNKNGANYVQGTKTPIFGLGLPASLDLNNAADIQTAKVQIAGALSVVEQAYQTLKTAATPAAVLALQKAQASGAAPKAITDQIANYQAALQRLTAGQSSSSSGGLASLL